MVFYDEDAVEAALDLFAGADVGVKPEGAGVFGGELVEELAAGLDGGLGCVGDAVHAVGDAHTMPVNSGGLGEVILELDS